MVYYSKVTYIHFIKLIAHPQRTNIFFQRFQIFLNFTLSITPHGRPSHTPSNLHHLALVNPHIPWTHRETTKQYFLATLLISKHTTTNAHAATACARIIGERKTERYISQSVPAARCGNARVYIAGPEKKAHRRGCRSQSRPYVHACIAYTGEVIVLAHIYAPLPHVQLSQRALPGERAPALASARYKRGRVILPSAPATKRASVSARARRIASLSLSLTHSHSQTWDLH